MHPQDNLKPRRHKRTLTTLMTAVALLAQACRPALPTPAAISWPPAVENGEPAVREQLRGLRDRIAALDADAAASPTDRAAIYGEAGQALAAYEAFDAARAAFANAASLDEGSYRWAYYLALQDLRAGDLAAAEAGFRRTLKLQQDFLPADIQLCRVLRLEGEYKEMTDRLWPLLKQPAIGDSGALVRFLLAEEAIRIGQLSDAARLLEEAVAMKPQAGLAHSRLVEVYDKLGDKSGAARHASLRGDAALPLYDPLQQEILEISRASISWVQRAESFEAQGKLPEAEALYKRALELNGGVTLTALKLGRVQVKLGKAQDAALTLEAALKTAGATSAGATGSADLALVRRWLAEARFNGGDMAGGLAEIDRALTLAPAEGEALGAKANLLRRKGDCTLAGPLYLQAIRALPERSPLRVQAALCLSHAGDDTAAMALVDEGLRALPDDDPLSDAKARLLAASPTDALRDGAASTALATANATRRRGVDTLQTLAMALAETGQFDEASRVQAEAIQMAKARKMDDWLAALQADLLGYSGRRPSREPWPAFLLQR